ncbi:MAG TPA: DUF2804 domain-containing protein [Candidatus Hydrogenedentes bacterium]|nr:DUF2804 domain-containing protein [Candidatus Hydrogenedentota bacterium]
MTMAQREITSECLLCKDNGELNPDAVGWSRRPFHVCNLHKHFPRKKKWNYWCVTGDRFLLSATIAHLDYLSLGAIYFLEYDTGRFAEQAAVKFFPRLPRMAETVDGTEHFSSRAANLVFECIESGVAMSLAFKRFDGKPFEASIEIKRPPGTENLNVVVPWNKRLFQFTSKHQCLPATGTLVWGNEKLVFAPGASFACLDFGRGVWPYNTAWNWAAFSGYSGADVIGINMGAKWTDGAGANENGILLNGRLHKIHEDIVFEYDGNDFMRPWRMRTQSSQTVRLEFAPFYEKAGALNLLVISAKTHQMFGRFSGILRVDGKPIAVDNVLGWAEEHQARW